MSTPVKVHKQCASKTKKPGNPLCTTPAVINFDGKDYCKQHAKINGWVDVVPAVTPAAAKPAAVAATPAVAATKPVAAVPATTKSTSKDVVKPPEVKNGICEGIKVSTKAACTHPAKFTCPDTCPCGGKRLCGVCWNSTHKNMNVSGGKSSTKKEIPDDKKCSHNKKSGDKGPCSKPAYGVDADGKLACTTHGGPKKEGSATASSGGGSSTGSGVFVGLNWPRLMTEVTNFTAEFYATGEEEQTALSEASKWLRDLIAMFTGGQPETEKLLVHFAKSAWSAFNDAEFAVTYKHTMLYVLRQQYGEEDTNWLVRMYGNLSKEAGNEAAQVATIWTAAAKECGLPTTPVSSTSTSGTGSSTKGAAVVTSNRKATVQSLIAKSKAAAASSADDKGEEEVDGEPELKSQKVEQVEETDSEEVGVIGANGGRLVMEDDEDPIVEDDGSITDEEGDEPIEIVEDDFVPQ